MTVRQIGGGPSTVVDVLRAAAVENAQVEAYVEMAEPLSEGVVPAGADGRRRLTFAQWDAAADGVAALLAERGVTKGDVVCLLLPSSIDYAVCYQAAARIGAITTGVNLRMGAAEQASIMARVHPAVTIVDTRIVAEEALAPGWGTVLKRDKLGDARSSDAYFPLRVSLRPPIAF